MSYNILAFCGGGIRGLASVTMLNQLIATYPNIISGANMLAGTSTGAGIVAALANNPSPSTPSDLITTFLTSEVNFYNDLSFNPTSDPSMPQYNVATFAADVAAEYGLQTLADLKTDKGFDILMTSFNIGDYSAGTPWAPILFNNLAGSANASTFVCDAVVASGAMQGMFGAYQNNVDGAYVHHDPTLAAIALAVQSGVSLTDIAVVCFGTGLMTTALGSDAASWGPQQWQQGDAGNEYKLNPLLVNGSISPVLGMSLNGTSTGLIPLLAQMMLGSGRYAYLNPPLDYFIPENDTISADLTYLQDQSLNAQLVDYAGAGQVVANNWPSIAITTAG